MSASLAVPTSTPAGKQRLTFHGDGGEMFGIFIVNALLSIVTLGIYSFWGKVKMRKYLHSQTELLGDRFEYHGTGKELFIGALKALAILAAFGGVGALLMMLSRGLGMAFIYIGIYAAIPYAIWSGMRYRLSRTSWRGIRFNFNGNLGECYKTFASALLVPLTLGIYAPYFRANMRGYWLNNSYFGNKPFRYTGTGGDLLGSFFMSILLTIPTLYLCWIWFAAKEQRYDWSHTRFEGAQFSSDVKGGDLLVQALVNGLLIMFTLGIAFPWVMARMLRFFYQHLAFEGDLNATQIIQDPNALKVSATGEGIADALDVGAVLG